MGLYYQAVMDKSKLEEANRLQNKIENLKIEITHISNFGIEGLMPVTDHYDSCFRINEDIAKTCLPMIKESMEKELKEYGRLFSEL